MLSNTYGKKIKKEDANRHFDLVMQIKERWHDKLQELLKTDPEALRYYCGKDIDFKNDLCYVFDKDTIEPLRDKMVNGLADGLIIFNGVRAQKDSLIEGTVDGYSDKDGRPTLMLFAYKMTKQETEKGELELKVLNGDDEGYEHPGTGGKPGGVTKKDGKYVLPDSFGTDQIQFIPS